MVLFVPDGGHGACSYVADRRRANRELRIANCGDAMAQAGVTVGISPSETLLAASLDERRRVIGTIADAGLDGLLYADHVSFRGGFGTEGLVLMAGLSQLHPTLELHMGLYLLPLRHPVPVARALATLSELAPGRLVFGVGVGGEDRHEVEVCGVDPRTRGRRCDESLEVLRGLLRGDTVSFHGEFFDIDNCLIRPTPAPAIPVLVGGRSDAAVRRAGRFGDGWLASWCSPRRFSEAINMCTDHAAMAGRVDVAWRHKYQLWVGLAADRASARECVRKRMEGFYRIPFAQFEKYTPFGTPADVAEALRPFVDIGVRDFDITPCAPSDAEAIELAGEVKRLLNG